jgi:hypothetical protein
MSHNIFLWNWLNNTEIIKVWVKYQGNVSWFGGNLNKITKSCLFFLISIKISFNGQMNQMSFFLLRFHLICNVSKIDWKYMKTIIQLFVRSPRNVYEIYLNGNGLI